MDLQAQIIRLILFVLPAYFANATPVVFHGRLPMDFGLDFIDKRRILGDGKTWVGFFVGITAGTLIGFIETTLNTAGYLGYNSNDFVLVAFLLSAGTMIGDSLGSFIKRRLNVERGKQFLIMDQLLFLISAILFVSVFFHVPYFLTVFGFAFLLVLTYILHPIMNFIANKLGLKSVPW